MLRVDIKATGKHIKEIMSLRDIKASQVASRCGFSTTVSVYKWLNGKGLPSIDNLVILADMLNVSIDELLVVKES